MVLVDAWQPLVYSPCIGTLSLVMPSCWGRSWTSLQRWLPMTSHATCRDGPKLGVILNQSQSILHYTTQQKVASFPPPTHQDCSFPPSTHQDQNNDTSMTLHHWGMASHRWVADKANQSLSEYHSEVRHQGLARCGAMLDHESTPILPSSHYLWWLSISSNTICLIILQKQCGLNFTDSAVVLNQ